MGYRNSTIREVGTGRGTSRKNSAVKIYVNGRNADGFYELSRQIGQHIDRTSRAHQRAVASLIRKVQPVSTKAIRDVFNIKAATVRGRTKVTQGARAKGDFVSLWASARKISLVEFGGRWAGVKSSGATAAIRKGQRKTYAHAFIANVGWRGVSGKSIKQDTVHRGIYVRRRGPNGKPVGRGPLVRLYGPSVFEMVSYSGSMHSADSVRNTIVPQLESFYTTELTRQIALELRRG